MKTIAYGKLGRVIEIDPARWGEVGGDNEPAALLLTLADRNPDVQWLVVGRNRGWVPPRPNITNMWREGWHDELKFMKGASQADRVARYDEVTMPTFERLDGVVLWLGQHGTSNTPIPTVDDRDKLTHPQESFLNYSGFLLRGINRWRKQRPRSREEIWLLPDVRNYLKGRDLKWPRAQSILSQFCWDRQQWVERYEDPRSPSELGYGEDLVLHVVDGKWLVRDKYTYDGLELTSVPPSKITPGFEDRRYDFGVIANEARNYGMRPELMRVNTMLEYAMPAEPSYFYGTWSEEGQTRLGARIDPLPYEGIFPLMEETKTTITTPTSGSGWPTLKTWEAFRSGTICFMHPLYDTQDHILPLDDPDEEVHWLRSWLRCTSAADFRTKVKAVCSSRTTYEWLAGAQYRLLARRVKEQRCVTEIERRLGIARQ